MQFCAKAFTVCIGLQVLQQVMLVTGHWTVNGILEKYFVFDAGTQTHDERVNVA